MAINSSAISSISTKQEFTLCLAVQRTPPPVGQILDDPVEPGLMIAYYDAALDRVQLFVADELGYQWYKVG